MKRKLDVLRSPTDDRDFLAESIFPTYNLPTKINYIKHLKPIRDQGSQGACVGFAGSCMKEVHENLDVKLKEYLSPQFIYNNRKNKNIEGMYMRDLMQILQKKGVCKEKTYKYGRIDNIPNIAFKEAKNFNIRNYAQIRSMSVCKASLIQNGPCVLAVPVYHYGENMWDKKSSGDPILGGHAMCIVGYDDKKEHFIVRNSWDNDWGKNGYTFFPYKDWGKQWEIWTTIDEKSYIIPEKCNWRCRLLKWLKNLF